MGLSVSELRALHPDLKEQRPNLFSTAVPPSPHDAFEMYYLHSSSSTGLCNVIALGKTIATNLFGEELKRAHKSLRETLIEKYGSPSKDFNFLRKGSLWTKPEDWMMGLHKGDRTVMVIWEKPTKNVKGVEWPNDLLAITLDADSNGTASGYVTLKYAFANEPACHAENKKQSKNSL